MSYKAGRRSESDLVTKFYKYNFAAIRTPGSGRARKDPLPDVIARSAQYDLCFAVQVKRTKGVTVYISYEEINDLVTFSCQFGAIPLFALSVLNKGFYIYTLNDLIKARSTVKMVMENGIPLKDFFKEICL